MIHVNAMPTGTPTATHSESLWRAVTASVTVTATFQRSSGSSWRSASALEQVRCRGAEDVSTHMMTKLNANANANAATVHVPANAIVAASRGSIASNGVPTTGFGGPAPTR